ncbi:CXXC motif containing zinc binding protein-like isoform X1 [Macrobrachium nipponense]|uniref:CXXC motif containing zinc binding protein-like isoform X1 n=1 Tax=Macrobrachium nipponense TaxID=159736 RepID=UPI0030C8B8FA
MECPPGRTFGQEDYDGFGSWERKVFKVAIRAQLENITALEAPGDDFQYCIKIKCTSCNEEADKWQYVSADEQVEMPGSRGVCNLLIKCKLCKKINSMDVLMQHKKLYNADDVPNLKEIIAFDCRGLAVTGFQFGEGWQCKGAESGTQFTILNLDEDWCDYDEKQNCTVGITELEYKIL